MPNSYNTAWDPARAQHIAANATKARRWLLGLEANGRSEGKDSALLKWGLTRVGVAESGVGLVLSELPVGPLNGQPWAKRSEHMEALRIWLV